MKPILKTILELLIILFISHYLIGCRFYKHKVNVNPSKYENSVSSYWESLDDKNFLIVHLGDDMQELYEVYYDEENQSVSGKLRAFSGPALTYYELIKNDESNKIHNQKVDGANKNSYKQVHFHFKDEPIPNGNELTFSIPELRHAEVSKKASGINALVTLGVIIVPIGIALAIVCNCPHIYMDDGSGLQLTNSIFTGAKAWQLERNDYKILPDYHPNKSELNLSIANEENENQYTNLLELLIVNHAPDIQIVPDKTGKLHTIRNPESPISATDNNQRSLIDKLSKQDDFAYGFDADSLVDLSEVFLSFTNPAKKNNAKLMLRLKNTDWSGYVYNEFNSLFGKNHAKWVKSNVHKPREEREQWMRDQGIKLLVEMKTSQGWELVDEIELVGEISFNSIVVPLALDVSQENVQVRIQSGFKFWDLDYVALDFSANQEVDVQVLKPSFASGENGQDYLPALQNDDSLYMETSGSKAISIVTFEGLESNAVLERTLILRAKGYYVSNKQYTGKTYRKELQKFKMPGELSRFSRNLYEEISGKMAIK